MNKNLKLILIFVILVAVLAGAGVLYNDLQDQVNTDQLATQPTEPTQATQPADPTEATRDNRSLAPDIEVIDWEGNTRKLSEFYGKPIILNFWASWCSPCKSEMPEFQEAYDTYGEEIHFILINCTDGSRETRKDAMTFIRNSGYTFPVYFDTTGNAGTVYQAYSIPLTYFIDSEGYLTAYASGALSAELLQQGIDMIYQP